MKNTANPDFVMGIIASIVFISLGIFFFRGVFLKPVSEINRAKNWVETECVIKSMNFKETEEGPSSNPEIEVVYHYKFNDKEYKSDVYELCGSFNNLKQSNGAMYRAGNKTVCFVNPENPAEAVLIKPEYSDQLWWGILPIGFIVVAVCIFVTSVVKKN